MRNTRAGRYTRTLSDRRAAHCAARGRIALAPPPYRPEAMPGDRTGAPSASDSAVRVQHLAYIALFAPPVHSPLLPAHSRAVLPDRIIPWRTSPRERAARGMSGNLAMRAARRRTASVLRAFSLFYIYAGGLSHTCWIPTSARRFGRTSTTL